ncbi:MAG TPA: response regulator, partial [Candidatus Saccharimonadales bacterium]|nr:response regulator [Candidatus Saccharimonadales bacterium]
MTKIMLVEDDNNLREIYEARLLAEGYEIVSAKDGEEALALAVKEKPDLIISDVMMPKISGFDMLDILRSTPETQNTKVIMMTALSQAEDKTRADKLGANRYLVKSQVTLEDVARVAREVLSGEESANAAPVAGTTTASASEPVAPVADAGSTDTPATTDSTTDDAAVTSDPLPLDSIATPQTIAPPPVDESSDMDKQIHKFVAEPAAEANADMAADDPLSVTPEPGTPDP